MVSLLFALVGSFVAIYLNIWFLLLLFENRKKLFKRKNTKKKDLPKISILVPFYNEEKNISNNLKSLLELDYPKDRVEIIAVDDGSKDESFKIAKSFERFGVKVLSKKHGGKAEALNLGLKVATGDFIGIIDADTFVEKDSLKKMINYFDGENVGAVTNFIRVDESKGFFGKMQNIEYLIASINRKILSIFDSYYITPGTLCLIRGKLAKEIGFSKDTLTEDMDFALSIIKRGYKILNCLEATVHTTIPKTFIKWFRQRIRWYRGYIQNSFKHRDILFNKKFFNIGFYIIPITGFLAISLGIAYTIFLSIDLLQNFLVSFKTLNYLSLFDHIQIALTHSTEINKAVLSPYFIISYLMVIISSLFVLIYSLKYSKAINFLNIILLPFYMFVYYSIIMLNWLIALMLEIFRWKKRW